MQTSSGMHYNGRMCLCVITQESAMYAERHPLSSDRRLHTEDLAVAHHVFILVRAHGSR